MKKIFGMSLIATMVFINSLGAQTIIPEPLKIEQSQGRFTFNSQTTIAYNSRTAINEAHYLAKMFKITSDFILKRSQKDRVEVRWISRTDGSAFLFFQLHHNKFQGHL